MSVIIRAENENEKISFLYDLCLFFAFSLLVFHTDFFKNCSPYPIFGIFHFPPTKKGVGLGEGRELCILIENSLYITIFNSFYVCLFGHFDVFWIFLLFLAMFEMVFCKNIQNFHFYDQIKRMTSNSFHSPIERE